jgi:pimeloyl-ACP methyl ester carboxylesterase
MSRLLRAALIVALLGGLLPAASVAADTTLPPSFCVEVPQPSSNEIYLICVPPDWSEPFDVVVFAHGYVPPVPDMKKYYEQLYLPGDVFLPNLVNGLGYAFISTSYTKNGLAVKEGLADTVRLIKNFKADHLEVGRVYLIGASEGGLITTLAAEKGAPIAGGLALCGPIGNFRSQINYWGDFRVLFDYFYPGALPPSPIAIPPEVILGWETTYAPQIAGLIGNPANLHTTEQLLRTSRAPIDLADPVSAVSTTLGILSYNVFATNEAIVELKGGQPFDNKYKWYSGSANDWALNGPGGVQRFKADLIALLEISRYYQTSGKLKVPLVTMHTLGDPIVPYWHETLYNIKTLYNAQLPYNAKTPYEVTTLYGTKTLYDTKMLSGGSALKHLNIPINRYGHCTFTAEEALAAFAVLHYMVTGHLSEKAPSDLAPAAQDEYQTLVEKFRSQLPKP